MHGSLCCVTCCILIEPPLKCSGFYPSWNLACIINFPFFDPKFSLSFDQLIPQFLTFNLLLYSYFDLSHSRNTICIFSTNMMAPKIWVFYMKRPNLCCLITLMVSMPFMFPRQLFIITPSRVVPPSSFVSFQSFFQFNFSFSFLLFLLYKYLFWLFISFLFFLSKLHLLHLPRFKSFSLCFSPVFSSLVFCIHHVFFFSIKRMANDS